MERPWLARLLSQDPTASTKRAAFGLVVLASVTWLSAALREGLSPQWNEAFRTLAALVGLGYVGGLVANKIAGGSDAPQPPAPAGTEDKERGIQ